MKFSEALIKELRPQWEANHDHPFVKELAAATLSHEKFQFYLKQDYLYLIDYTKVLALGVVKAPDLAIAQKFSQLVANTLNSEMATHRAYAKRFGISLTELTAVEPTPTTLGYTNYMLSIAQIGDLANVLVAILPCMWSYAQIGRALMSQPAAKDEWYSEWVRSYNDPDYQALTQWTIALLDRVAAGKSAEELAKLKAIFLNTTKYEYLFWEMAYHETTWPQSKI